jgi:hypothetical protein
MKRTILYFAFLLFVSTGIVNAQKYGLGNTDPSVFTKFRIPETNLSKIWIDTYFYLNIDKSNNSYIDPEVSGSSSEYNTRFNYSLNPNYYLLKESENNFLLLDTRLSGGFNQEYSEIQSPSNLQKSIERNKSYGTDFYLKLTDNNYINQSNIFYSLGSDIQFNIDYNKFMYSGNSKPDIDYFTKQQYYSFLIGAGFGKQRNVTPVVSAIRFQERLKQLNMLNNDLSEKTIENLAQQFYKQIYYPTIHERPDKYFWGDIGKTLLQDGVELKELNMYAVNYLEESVNEVRFLRNEACIAGLNLRGNYQNSYHSSSGNVDYFSEEFLTLCEAYFRYSHQLNLNSQINFGMTVSGGPNITKHPSERQQYSFEGNVGYNYELTDRLVANSTNDFILGFQNYNQQEKFLSNILDFRLSYFIEDNFSLNANYQWNYSVRKNFLYYENSTDNNHSINLSFTYYFEKGFLTGELPLHPQTFVH